MGWLEKELDGESTIRSTRRYALLMGARIKSNKEECVGSMVLRSR
jgi:hypothetical protein